MPAIVPFIPLIASGITAVGGIIASKKAQKSAMQRNPDEQAALTGATGAAEGLTQQNQEFLGQGRELMGQGRELIGQGKKFLGQGGGFLGQAGNYYSTLLGGGRASMAQATAGPRAAITDVYRGAERGLERSGVRGAARDVATADLGRQRAGQLSSLVTGIQPGAAAGLAGLSGQALGASGQAFGASGQALGAGGQMFGAGGQLLSNSGSIYSNLLGQGMNNRMYGRQEGQNFGSGVGSFLFDILNRTKFGKSGGGSVAGAGVFAPNNQSGG